MGGEIKIRCNTNEHLPYKAITPFQGELKRRSKEQTAKLAASILKHGWAFPEFIWRSAGVNYCLDGHGRLAAASELEKAGHTIPDIPVVYIEADNEAEAKELLLKLNSQYGIITQEGFNKFVEDIDIDLSEYELPNIREPHIDLASLDIYEAPQEGETRTRPGDLIVIGSHRLICGDSTDAAVLDRLMQNEKADMVFTAPPYGVAIGHKNPLLPTFGIMGGNTPHIKNDSLGERELESMLAGAFKNVCLRMKDDASFYTTFPQTKTALFERALTESGLSPRHILIWVKNHATFSLNRLDYEYQHEPIFYGWKKTHKFYGLGKFRTTVWSYDKPQASAAHPTMKPSEMIINAIENSMEPPRPVGKAYNAALNSTIKNDIILDPFGGSGSTMAAAEAAKRRARLVEIDPVYCDTIIERMLGAFEIRECYIIRADGSREEIG
jgi:DNA modification methylase